MLTPATDKEDGWKEWLQEYCIYDESKSNDEMYLRYMKLKDITFPLMPKSHWGYLFRDLVSIEEGLVFGDAIGCCDTLPFRFDIVGDECIRSKPIMYAKEERDWIN
jgi:hypothetical protein